MCPFFDDLSKFADFVYTPQCVTRIGEMVAIVVVQQFHMANVACSACSCVVRLCIGGQYLQLPGAWQDVSPHVPGVGPHEDRTHPHPRLRRVQEAS